MHGAMDVLSALANSPSNDIVDKISKCLYLYCSDASNHSIVVKNVGDLITRLTDRTKRTTNLSIIARRLLVRSICFMSSSACCRSLVEDNIVTSMLHLCFEDEELTTNNGHLENNNSDVDNTNAGNTNTGDTNNTNNTNTDNTNHDMTRTIDLITILANFSHTGNTAKMVRDGACGALVSLVQQFRGTNKSQNGRIACALRNLTCYLGNAARMVEDGVIEAILELSDDSKYVLWWLSLWLWLLWLSLWFYCFANALFVCDRVMTLTFMFFFLLFQS